MSVESTSLKKINLFSGCRSVNLKDNNAATIIQTIVRGHLARKRYTRMRYDHLIANLKVKTKLILKQLIQVSNRVEMSWRRQIISQQEQIESLEELKSIRDTLMLRKKLFESLIPKNEDQLEQTQNAVNSTLSSTHTRLGKVCEKVGFKSVKKGLEITYGADWKERFSTQALGLIDDIQMVFTPTACMKVKVEPSDDDDSLCQLVKESGDTVEVNSGSFASGLPFFNQFRLFQPSSGLDRVQGAELYLPIKTDDGSKKMFVIKGIFGTDSIKLTDDIHFISKRREQLNIALNQITAIPEKFQKVYLQQYPLKDLLLNTNEDIIAEMTQDFQFIQGAAGKVLPSFMAQFNQASFERKVKLFSLLLLKEDLKMALFLYDMMLKDVPQFIKTIKSTLHFSLLKKLNIATQSLEDMKQKFEAMKVDHIPYETRILQSKMSDETKLKALGKMKYLKGGEKEKTEKYLDGLLTVPFGTYTKEPVNKNSSTLEKNQYLQSVKKSLDSSVYGHQQAKKAILEWVGQRISNGTSIGECIGIEGPPGNGKTTLAKKGIAKALGRPLVFISVGGQSGASALVGHDLTYVSSTWGRIVEALRESKCMDPIFLIDEADKISRTKEGKELIGILTSLTDFTQNDHFQDKYFSGVKFDLSRALFLLSYNDENKLDSVFKDRLKKIKTGPLSLEDKIHVAQNHQLPEIFEACGFKKGDIVFDNKGIEFLVSQYTDEGGARKLKENLFAIVRSLNLQRIMNPDSIKFPYRVDRKAIIKILNEPKIEFKKVAQKPMVGMANGLFYSSTGTGGITFVQAYKTLSKERFGFTLTGMEGDKIKESMAVARSVALNLLPSDLLERFLKSPLQGMHIHALESNTSEHDGPSIGAAMTTAIVSQLSGIPIHNHVAMTGEIDLTGRIFKVDGLASKLLGAKRADAKLVLCPRENKKDLEGIMKKSPELFSDDFQVLLVDSIHDVLDHALVKNPIPRTLDFISSAKLISSGSIIIQDSISKKTENNASSSSKRK